MISRIFLCQLISMTLKGCQVLPWKWASVLYSRGRESLRPSGALLRHSPGHTNTQASYPLSTPLLCALLKSFCLAGMSSWTVVMPLTYPDGDWRGAWSMYYSWNVSYCARVRVTIAGLTFASGAMHHLPAATCMWPPKVVHDRMWLLCNPAKNTWE